MSFFLITAACVAFGVYMAGTVGFWAFVQVFGVVDGYMQDRHFAKR